MVPGSTFRYGSNFMMLTLSPRLSSRHPSDAAASPLPNEDTTPPVTKMYFAAMLPSFSKLGRRADSERHTDAPLEKLETRNEKLFLRLLHPGWKSEWLCDI